MLFRILMIVCSVSGILPSATPPTLRLPDVVMPLGYQVDLTIDPQSDTYQGSVSIDVRVNRPTDIVWLHSVNLDIRSVQVGGATVTHEKHEPFLALQADRPFAQGQTRIVLQFSASFNKVDVEGLFKQVEGNDAYVFTQFEPTGARRAFPCFDEPGFKTPWQITLRVPAGLKAFANTPELDRKPGSGGDVVRFAASKPMPTYLVALAAGPFDVVQARAAGKNKVRIRTLALKGRGGRAGWTTEVTPKLLEALEEYFSIPYPYDKLDQVTIPVTVAFGAMENAGLITYQQNLLLAPEGEDSEQRRRSSAEVITHELAHQWFGNMVTPAWWDDIWLNEAFATWMERVIIDRVFPEWRNKNKATVEKAQVMKLDHLTSARRIRQPIGSEGDIGNAFDGITYQKGSAVIRMFEQYSGDERFQRGIRNYLRKHAWGNATSADFLAAISSAAGRNISSPFSTFLDRGGLPLIEVELDCKDKPRLQLSQSRFAPVGSNAVTNQFWSVPVCVRYTAGGREQHECFLLSDPRDTAVLRSATTCPDWLTLNDDAAGYYHWLPDSELRRKLVAGAATRMLPHEQVDWLRNVAALASSNKLQIADVLDAARALTSTRDEAVLSAALDVVLGLRRSLPAGEEPRFARLLQSWFGTRAEELGWQHKNGDSADTRLLRTHLVPAVAMFGESQPLVDEARRLAQQWLKDPLSLSADIASGVLGTAAAHGDSRLFEEFVAAAKGARDANHRQLLIRRITAFSDPEIAMRTMQLLLDPAIDIREWLPLIFMGGNRNEIEAVPERFVRENFDALLARLPSQLGTHPASILPRAVAPLCSEEQVQAAEAFFTPRLQQFSGAGRTLAIALEQSRLCIAARQVQSSQLAEYLRKQP